MEGITLSEINQPERDKYCMISRICGIKKKKNHTNKKMNSDTENRRVLDRGRGVCIGMDKMVDCDQRCNLLVIT